MTTQERILIEQLLKVSQRVLHLTQHLKDFKEFAEDKYIFDDVLSNVTVIYEINNKLSDELKNSELNNIDWKKISDYELIIRSDYHQLDLETLWNAIKKDLPILVNKLQKIINQN
jgi:uncharacterized protein with HEPN domain